MKRVVLAAERRSFRDLIKKGFESAGCSDVELGPLGDKYCEIKLTLPNGHRTTTTVWFDRSKVDVGDPKATKVVKPVSEISETWTFDSNGDVLDDDGVIVGKVKTVELNQTVLKQRTRSDYDTDSVRTDSGDVILDHPEKAGTYKDVVKSLETRKITQRS